MSVAYITDCATSPVKLRHQSCHRHNIISLHTAYNRSYKRFYLSSQKYSKSPQRECCPISLAEPEIILSLQCECRPSITPIIKFSLTGHRHKGISFDIILEYFHFIIIMLIQHNIRGKSQIITNKDQFFYLAFLWLSVAP